MPDELLPAAPRARRVSPAPRGPRWLGALACMFGVPLAVGGCLGRSLSEPAQDAAEGGSVRGGADASPTETTDASTSAPTTIGPSGGVVRLGDASLTVPRGALSTAVTIRITLVPGPPPAGYEVYSPVYAFSPAGLTFALPATVRLPELGAPASAAVQWSLEGSPGFGALATTISGDFASAPVTHFSTGFVGRPTASVSDAGADAVTLADATVHDASAPDAAGDATASDATASDATVGPHDATIGSSDGASDAVTVPDVGVDVGLADVPDASVGSGDGAVDATPEAAADTSVMDSSAADACATVCSGVCTDLLSDPANCGACGHDCSPGSCAAGACQAYTLYAGSGGPNFIAVSGGTLVWSNYATNTVSTCAASACTPTTFTSSASVASGVAIDGTNVYWVDETSTGSVNSCAEGASCASIDTLASYQGSPYGLALAAGNLYWTDYSGGAVMTCPVTGCGGVPTALASGQSLPWGVAVDATSIYFTDSDASSGSVLSCPLSGCGGAPTVLASGLAAPYGIAVDGTNVYWANFNAGTIQQCAKTGCSGAPTTLVTGLINPAQVVVDATNLYWTDYGGATVGRCAIGACSPVVLASAQQGAFALTEDATRLYWGNQIGGEIVMLAK